MSNAPYLLPARFGYRLGNGELIDHMVFDGLTSSFDGRHMVQQASFVSRDLGISRDQDEWAYRSHQRAAAAREGLRRRDRPRRRPRRRRASGDTTLAKLSSLSRCSTRRHDDRGQRSRRERRCVLRGRLLGGTGPPSRAAGARHDPLAGLCRRRLRLPRADTGARGERALAKAGKRIGDVKRVEINEAFASVAKNSTQMLGADEEVVNVNGGAVALGHPIGASGGRIVGTMVHELRRSGGGLGLAAICSGGGQGDALLIEV